MQWEIDSVFESVCKVHYQWTGELKWVDASDCEDCLRSGTQARGNCNLLIAHRSFGIVIF